MSARDDYPNLVGGPEGNRALAEIDRLRSWQREACRVLEAAHPVLWEVERLDIADLAENLLKKAESDAGVGS